MGSDRRRLHRHGRAASPERFSPRQLRVFYGLLGYRIRLKVALPTSQDTSEEPTVGLIRQGYIRHSRRGNDSKFFRGIHFFREENSGTFRHIHIFPQRVAQNVNVAFFDELAIGAMFSYLRVTKIKFDREYGTTLLTERSDRI